MDYLRYLPDVVFPPLLGAVLLMLWFAKSDAYWWTPAQIVTLLVVIDCAVMGKTWSALFGVGLFMYLFGASIISLEREATRRPPNGGVPFWARPTPDKNRPVKPRGYHRPDAVESRTQEMNIVQS